MSKHEKASSDDLRLPMRWAPVQFAALAVGVVFLLVGTLGFIPGSTKNMADLAVAGQHSGAMLMGLFNVSILHNIVHLGFGLAGGTLARQFRAARGYLIIGGVVYLLLWLYGSLIDHDSAMNFVPFNNADNWLHLGLGVGMVGLGLALSRRRSDTAAVGQVSPSNVSR